jgi:hypothetical protein
MAQPIYSLNVYGLIFKKGSVSHCYAHGFFLKHHYMIITKLNCFVRSSSTKHIFVILIPMAPSTIRKAIGAVKDTTSIGLAKVGSSASLADLDVAIVKATRHDDYPAEERHIREILSLTCYSRAYISACVNTLSRRLNKTKDWTVALKTLALIQRLLSEGDPAYEQEIFFSTRRGTRLLNMSDFRDTSQSNSWDHSSFVRTYGLYLDERLEFRMQSRRGKRSAFGFEEEEEEHNQAGGQRATPVREMKIEKIFSRMQHLQQLLERFLACRPTGL